MKKIDKLLNALQYLFEEKIILGSKVYSLSEYDELTDILIEILKSIYQSVGIREIEKKINQGSKLDIVAFKSGLNIIKDNHPHEIVLTQSADKTIKIEPPHLIKNITNFLAEIENKAHLLSQLDILIKLELTMDTDFERLLMTFDRDHKVFNELKELVLPKMNTSSDDEILLLWSKIKSSIKNDGKNGFYMPYDDILPDRFFNSKSTLSIIRDKCALFIIKYKPLITKKMVEDGYNFFPTGIPGVARILALPNNSDILPIEKLDTLLFRTISKTIALYSAITHIENEALSDFALAIGADPNDSIFSGNIYREYKERLRQNKIKPEEKNELLILNLKRLVKYSSMRTKEQIFIEDALWQYKLGQEVIAPIRNGEFETQQSLELFLQKDLCKFLIERSILAFGRSFGQSQIDLYHKEIHGEDFIIEAKVYKGNKKLNLKSLQRNIVQLQSYMDQIVQPKGILAIYNFTNDIILAPRQWLKGRMFIICINLCSLSPSKRRKSVEIIESEDKIVDLIEVGD